MRRFLSKSLYATALSATLVIGFHSVGHASSFIIEEDRLGWRVLPVGGMIDLPTAAGAQGSYSSFDGACFTHAFVNAYDGYQCAGVSGDYMGGPEMMPDEEACKNAGKELFLERFGVTLEECAARMGE